MPRNRNTDINGMAFGDITVGAVWKRGRPDLNPDSDYGW